MTVYIDGHSITCTVDEYIELKNKLEQKNSKINKITDIDPKFWMNPSDNKNEWWTQPTITCKAYND